jgi:hypothetical protein
MTAATPDAHRRFVEQIVSLICVRLDLATDEAIEHGYDRFYEGRAYTLAELVSTMKDLAPGFGIDIESIGLPDRDVVHDYHTALLNKRT